MPSTIVQKMTGAIIILIRLTNIVPSTPSDLPVSGASRPTMMPATTPTITMMYSQWVRSFLVCFGSSSAGLAALSDCVISGSLVSCPLG